MQLEKIADELRYSPSEDLLMQNYNAYFASAESGLPFFQETYLETVKYMIR